MNCSAVTCERPRSKDRSPLGLGEGDHNPDEFGTRHQHVDTVQTEGDSPVGRRPVFERVEEETELAAGVFVAHPEGLENHGLDILAMNPDAAPADFGAVRNQLIGVGESLPSWHPANEGRKKVPVIHHMGFAKTLTIMSTLTIKPVRLMKRIMNFHEQHLSNTAYAPPLTNSVVLIANK